MPRSRSASTSPVKPTAKSAAPLDFSTWVSQAEAAFEHNQGVKPRAVRWSDWRKLYVMGLSPEAAAERVGEMNS